MNGSVKRTSWLMSLLFLVAVVSTSFGGPTYTYWVSGKVTDILSGSGLFDAQVKIAGKTATTDPYGNYKVYGVSGGKHKIKATLVNYTIPEEEIEVTSNMPGQTLVGTGDNKVVDIESIAQRKDTTMICMDGCSRSSYKVSHQLGAPQQHGKVCSHDNGCCTYAAMHAYAKFKTGDITQDEIAFLFKKDKYPSPQPEGDLSHGEGSVPIPASITLMDKKFADVLQCKVADLNGSTVKPTETDVKTAIRDGRPIYYSSPVYSGNSSPHDQILKGYRYKDKVFECLFTNQDEDGNQKWREYATIPCQLAYTPKVKVEGKKKDPRIEKDVDIDGVNDFDELERWVSGASISEQDLKEENADTDNDGLKDGVDIEGYLYDGNTYNKDAYNPDSAEGRCEVDSDSDNGGVLDGDEDINHNGEVDAGTPSVPSQETNPYTEHTKPPDDIPKVQIELAPSVTVNDGGVNKAIVKAGIITATFKFLRSDGTTSLPVNSCSSVKAEYTPNGGAATTVPLTVSGTVPSATWTGKVIVSDTSTPNGKATWSLKNTPWEVRSVITVVAGQEFWIDTKWDGQVVPKKKLP